MESELATPTKDIPPNASPKMIRLPATSPKVNVSSQLKQQDTRRQFYTTRSAGNQKPLIDMSSKEEEGPIITQLVLKSSTGSAPCATTGYNITFHFYFYLLLFLSGSLTFGK